MQIIIANDGSTDNTSEEITSLIQEVQSRYKKIEWIFIDNQSNHGKGNAIKSALNHASCEVTVIHDADLEYYPQDIIKMMPLFIDEQADAVYGSRFAASDFRRVLMFRHELGNRLITFLCNFVSNLNLTDIETCYKAVKTDLLKTIPIESNDFRIEPELTIKLAKRRAKIFEVPIRYSGRTYEEGKKIGWQDGFKALWSIIKFGFSDNIFTHDAYGAKIIFRLSRARKFNNWMSETISPYVGQNILEIGAGIGNLTAAFLPRKSYNATDVNPLYLKMINRLKENSPFLKTAYLDLNDVSEFQQLGKRFDTIICLNVLEHIEDDQAALRNVACLLDPGGKAVVLVPQGQWLYGSLDQVLGHVKRYSQKELEYLSDQTGFDCNKIIEFNRVSTLPWFLNGRVFKTKTFSKFQMIMLEFLVPLFKVIDKFLPWPSTSLIAILTKK